MKRRLRVAGVLVAVAAGALLAFVLTRPPATPSQRIAAEFLGVAPWRLSSPGRRGEVVEVTEHEWGTVRESQWMQWRGLGITDWFGIGGRVKVDEDRQMVTACHWDSLAEKTAWWPPRWRDLDDEACIARAEAFLTRHSSVYSTSDELVARRPSSSRVKPGLALQWQGTGPGDLIHVEAVHVLKRTGKLTLYTVRLGTQPQANLTEIKVTPEQAEETVRASLPDNVFDAVVEASDALSWRGPYAPVGEPFYYVNVEAKIQVGDGTEGVCAYCDGFGVHATTGELLKYTGQ